MCYGAVTGLNLELRNYLELENLEFGEMKGAECGHTVKWRDEMEAEDGGEGQTCGRGSAATVMSPRPYQCPPASRKQGKTETRAFGEGQEAGGDGNPQQRAGWREAPGSWNGESGERRPGPGGALPGAGGCDH